jgi:hypothetical protein
MKKRNTQTGHTLRTHIKVAAINVALMLASLIIAMGFAEIAVRIFAPQQLILKYPNIWRSEDALGWVHQPNVRATINTGERTVNVFTDKDGFRVGRAGRIEAEYRILLLGDSFIEAFQVEHEQSLAGLLEQHLSHSLGAPVAVWNTAVGGWDPNQYLLQAQRSMSSETFDLVIVFLYLGNDIIQHRIDHYSPRAPTEVHPLKLPRSWRWRDIVNDIFYPTNDFLEVRSHLFVFLKHRAEYVLMQTGLTAAYFPDVLFKSEAGSDRWHITATICRDIAELAKTRKTDIVFVLIPMSYQIEPRTLNKYLKGFRIDPEDVDINQPNRLMAAALSGEKLSFVDLRPAFARAHGQGLRSYGDIDPHLSPEGHEIAAGVIEPIVLQRLRKRESRISN